MRPTFETVDDYLASMTPPVRALLRQVRATIRKALPRATEGISYQIPVYKVDGAMVLYFAGYEHHYSIYPASQQLVAALGTELSDRLQNAATIRFSTTERVPTALITRIAKARAAEVAARTPATALAAPAKAKLKPKPKPKAPRAKSAAAKPRQRKPARRS